MKHLEKELKDLIKKDDKIFKFIEENALDGLWYWDLTKPTESWMNEKFWKTLGYNKKEAQDHSLTWNNLAYPDDIKQAEELFRKHITAPAKYPFIQTIRYPHKDGHTAWMECRGTVVLTKDDKPYRMLGTFTCITQRKEAERQLQKNLKHFENVVDGANMGVWECDMEKGTAKYNERLAEIFGYTLEELGPLNPYTWLEYVHPDDMDTDSSSLLKSLKGDGFFDFEFRMKHKQGHWVWVRSHGKIVKSDADGNPILLAGSHHDITKRKQNEINLSHFKNLLEQTNNVAQIGYWEVNLKDQSVYWSDVTKLIHEAPSEYQPTLEHALNFYPEGINRDRIISAVDKAIQKGENYDLELQIKTLKGNTKWVRAIGISETDNSGNQRLYGLFQDIEKLKKTQLDIALSEEQFRQTFTHAGIGISLHESDNKLIKANKKLCDIIGYSEAELQTINLSSLSHPDDTEETKIAAAKLMSGQIDNFNLDKRFIHKDGSIIWTNVSVAAIRGDQGEIINLVAQIQDITENKTSEILLQKNADLLERVNETAQIGIWELNIIDETVNWSTTVKSIMGVPENFTPTLTEAIGFFKEGDSHDQLDAAIDIARDTGEGFDLELQIVTKDTQQSKWTRTIGITEFVDGQFTRLYGFFQDIDEKTKTNNELSLREEQFRQTFWHANIGMALINLDGKVTSANPSMCKIYGRTEHELKTIPLPTLSHPNDIEPARTFLAELTQGKRENFRLEKRFIHKDGHHIWVSISCSTVQNDLGEVSHIVGQLIDITSSKTNEILLNKYKRELEHSTQMAKIGSWEIDVANDNKTFWNPALKTILEVAKDFEPSLETALNFYPEGENRDAVTSAIERASTTGESFDITIQINTFKNTLKWVRAIGIADFKDGQCQKLFGLFQDIDDVKKAQIEVAIREEQFRQTFWHANIGMLFINLSGKISQANPHVCKMCGYTETELLSIPFNKISHPDDLEESQHLLKEIILGKRDNFQIEKRYLHKNGNIIWVSLSTSAVKNDKGELSHIVCQILDITENKLLNESIKEHNNRLVNFAHIVSHNLRSHTGNMAMLFNIQEESGSDSINSEIYSHIKTASENMNETVGYLSEIVEINTKIEDTLLSLNLYEYVNKTIQSIQLEVAKIECRIKVNIDPNLNVIAVPAYLDSIVLNLITNALKYHSPKRKPTINISAKFTEDYIYLSVTDNGQGMDLEKHGNKLFGMYKTFHEHEDARGIGLFISKNQIEAMGGKIEVESKVDKGTTFKISFKHEYDS